MRADDKRHGTSAGYYAHRKAGQRACPPCLNAYNLARTRRAGWPEEEIALADGEWVTIPRSGGVKRWVPKGQTSESGQLDVHALIACPTCHARVDQTCRTKSGHTTTPHHSRLAPRLCGCGSRLERYRRLCDTCQRARTTLSKRDYARRRRAADRQYVEQVAEVAAKFAAITERKNPQRGAAA